MSLSHHRKKTEEDLKIAISKLQKAMSKDGNNVLIDLAFPNSAELLSVEDGGILIGSAIEKVFEAIAKRSQGKGLAFKAKETAKKWAQASLPFAQVFLNVLKFGSAVRLPSIAPSNCRCLY